ncbi:MAG: ABC transporter substrate-binding protein [Clostridium sp.]|uniref:ABC transporter substrate-binding protein n=1 Tax=Clostridium sp. TaxID=1506 RepID=UPI003F388ACC
MLKKKLILSLIALISTTFIGCNAKDSNEKVVQIGICQLTQHEALDEANTGFTEKISTLLKEKGISVEIDSKNAQGDFQTAQTIGVQFASDKKDLIFAIATPAAQAMYNSTKEIPIVFTAVTDPVAAGIASGWDSSGNNTTGVSDMVPVDKQIDLMTKLIPATKKLGFIYNTSEANSLVQLELIKKECAKKGIEVVQIGITNVNEIEQNLKSNLNKIDALYLPTDNVVASAYSLVNKISNEKKIPVFCAEEAAVTRGGLATIGINYRKLGEATAEKAFEILVNKKNPSDIKIETSENLDIVINEDVAKELNITIPDDIKAKAKLVGTE